jgi:hypothetical protein
MASTAARRQRVTKLRIEKLLIAYRLFPEAHTALVVERGLKIWVGLNFFAGDDVPLTCCTALHRVPPKRGSVGIRGRALIPTGLIPTGRTV